MVILLLAGVIPRFELVRTKSLSILTYLLSVDISWAFAFIELFFRKICLYADLIAILSSLDIPELEPVPRDHVLTKTFFLLRDFTGRFTNGQLWVEALPAETEEDVNRPARAGDGVSSILITSNDLAGAWAMRPDGQPMLPLVPGEPRQREFAFRAGVNIVMYTLTGNYKADQVHAPALIERLGQ